VQLLNGRVLPTDIILLSTGVCPDLSCTEGSGIKTDRGILVNDFMETSIPNIYAAGDVAQWRERMWGIVPVALGQAAVAAANIAGEEKNIRELCRLMSLKW